MNKYVYHNKKDRFQVSLKIFLSLIIVLLLPSYVHVAFNANSLAAGLLISAILICFINYNEFIFLKSTPSLIYIFLLLFLGLFISGTYIYLNDALTKPLYSVIIIIVIFSAFVMTRVIKKHNYKVLSSTILIIILFLLLLGWIKIFYIITCCNYGILEKPVFPFAEESHYALAIGILSVSYISSGRILWILFIEINMLFLALYFPNLTLLVFVFLNLVILQLRISPKYLIPILILILSIVFLGLMLIYLNSDYFASRLNFNSGTNLTTLVFLQGWDMAYINLIETNLLGLNFQMLGIANTTSSGYTEKILQLTGANFNLEDGGFLASKIISEFGIVGLVLILYYFLFIIKSIFYINKLWALINTIQNIQLIDELKKKILMLGLLLGFSVEVFLRGYGYFSPSFFLIIVSVLYNLNSIKIKFYNKLI